jgi:hypothetical protein
MWIYGFVGLTRESSAAPSESAGDYLLQYFNHENGGKERLGVGCSDLLDGYRM